MMIIQQFFLGILFLIISVLIFTLPGFYLLKQFNKSQHEDLEKFVVYTVFGMVLFSLSAYILAALNLRFLMWGFPLFGLLILIVFRKELFRFKPKVLHKVFFLTVFIIGIIGQVAVNAPSGFPYEAGIYF